MAMAWSTPKKWAWIKNMIQENMGNLQKKTHVWHVLCHCAPVWIDPYPNQTTIIGHPHFSWLYPVFSLLNWPILLLIKSTCLVSIPILEHSFYIPTLV